MSLKAFHLFFITASIVLVSGVGVWAVSSGVSGYLATGLVAFAGAAALVVYEVGFLRKCKEMGL